MDKTSKVLIYNATIINEGKSFYGYVVIDDTEIFEVEEGNPSEILLKTCTTKIDAEKKWLIPGIIDAHVHFREPGLTHKADIYTESRAAVSGGVTSYFDMPNTIPQTINEEQWLNKYKIAQEKSFTNYSFYVAATNDNIQEITNLPKDKLCGIKVFLGSSTGGMLMDNFIELNKLFTNSKVPVVAHCEDENLIKQNEIAYKIKLGDNIPASYHPIIRNEEVCYNSTKVAVELAKLYNTRLHIAHISTSDELSLLEKNSVLLENKRITSEVSPQHLLLNDNDYSEFGMKMKINPAIKSKENQMALQKAIVNGTIDIIATDHAPHTLQEKNNTYFLSPSGMPMIEHSFLSLLQEVYKKSFTKELLVEKMCHSPAICFNVEKRGFIRKKYFADLVIIDPEGETKVDKNNIKTKCNWSVFEGKSFKGKIEKTFVNGKLVYDNGAFSEESVAMPITFNRKK